MQAGRGAGDRVAGQAGGERLEQGLASPAVEAAVVAQVTVEVAAGDQVRERQLVEDGRRRGGVGADALAAAPATRAAGPARASWRSSRRRSRRPARAPAASRPGGGRSGTRRRSRPRSTNAPRRRAHSISAVRRAGERTAPVGYWCAGVTKTAPTSSSSCVRRPSSSTGVGTGSRPARVSVAVSRGQHGSSIATRGHAARREQAPHERQARAEAAGDHDLVGARLHAAPAGQRRGQRLAQLGLARRVRVAEPGVGRGPQRALERAPPRRPERAVERGQRGAEVEPGRRAAHRSADLSTLCGIERWRSRAATNVPPPRCVSR